MSYDRKLVERLLPMVWDDTLAAYGTTDPQAPTPVYRCNVHPKSARPQSEDGEEVTSTCACVEPVSRRTAADPKLGGTVFAHYADIRRAWKLADVPQVERQALLLRFGLDWKINDIAYNQGVRRAAVGERIERGVGRLVAFLGGVTYLDHQDGDGELLLADSASVA